MQGAAPLQHALAVLCFFLSSERAKSPLYRFNFYEITNLYFWLNERKNSIEIEVEEERERQREEVEEDVGDR